jgi:CRISPR-associated endonuclease Csn1
LDDSESALKIKNEIDLGIFMPKQRTNQNGVIPFQLHQRELDQIIAKQGKYYPFLQESNPVSEHLNQAPYKLDELVRFRVPYYVGPMIAPKQSNDQQTQANQNFAWMVRRKDGQITPWNFDEQVDRMESANRFIKRMTTKDTYLLGEDVLPKHSLLYQKFEVLNELNNIRINGSRISFSDKQDVYKKLFKDDKSASVSVKHLTDYLKIEKHLPFVEIKGLANEAKFNSSLATYHELRKMGVFDLELDDPKYRTDFENIIEWATIFEDRSIYQQKLQTVSWLKPEQIKALTRLNHYQGWGRLSKKLLLDIHDSNGQNIMEQLWDSQKNFMQIVKEPDFVAQINAHNQQTAQEHGMEAILADAYTSPANKKAIRQVMKVVNDITRAASGKAPRQIAIEFARDAEKKPRLSTQRGRKLQQIYSKLSDEFVSEAMKQNLDQATDSRQLAHDKYFLYFMQLGRDAYSGKPINFDEIETKYQIDHILPQAFIKDDSLDNRVLVASELNNAKSDQVPVQLYAHKKVPGSNLTVRGLWDKWLDLKLISNRKHNNLLTDPTKINKYQKSGFIQRQLVETSQIIKLVSTILQEEYPDSEIIVVKASYNHDLRERLNLYKSRSVNDYHHAIDAYLSTICANFLYQVYPKLRPFFVYGQFKKFKSDPELEKDIIRQQRTFNFIWPLLKKEDPSDPGREIIHLNARSDGPVIFNRQTDIFAKLERAYNFKYMLLSRETSSREQEMFKMTLYPRSDRDTAKSRNLIPKAKNMPTSIYGGYSNNSDAYMAIVEINKKKGKEYRVIGVPMRALSKLKKAEKENCYDEVLTEVLRPIVMFDKNGKAKRSIQGFKVVKGRVLYKQPIKDGDKKFMLGSSTYVYNDKQLTLSDETMRIVTGNFTRDEDQDVSLVKAFDELTDKVNKYLPLYDINGFRNKLIAGRDKFIELSLEDKKKVIEEILVGLHDNPAVGNAKSIGIKTPFGFMQMKSGVVLSSDAELIYQSPTGLFEKKVRISDL